MGHREFAIRKPLELSKSLSFETAIAIEKLLRSAKRSFVQFLRAFHETEASTEFAVQGV